MTFKLTIKLTSAEKDVLDWLTQLGLHRSTSDTLRSVLMAQAAASGLSPGETRRVMEERETHRPRLTAAAVRRNVKREAERPQYRKRA